MKVFYGLTHFKPQNIKPAVALGVFDGLHLGHQRIIGRLIKEAERLKIPSLIVTFFPHPQKESSIYSLPHRLKLFKETGVDLCLVIRFSPAFCRISAREFLQKILVRKINPAIVLIGRNFTFGKNAQGNWQTLSDYSKMAKFKLMVIDVLTYKGIAISSSYIRNFIKTGQLIKAQKLLGRPVSIFGRVTGGCGFARTLGYPTANIEPDHETLPSFGVYAVRARVAGRLLNGICYIGNKPTFFHSIKKPRNKKGYSAGVKASSKTSVEAHIFDFENNLYGRRMQIEFVKRLRPEKRFNSVQALAYQIKRDILNCHKQLRLQFKHPQ
jgi:riboflavin kinase/FMN adenylyltransferase